MKTRKTTTLEKFSASFFNVLFVLIVFAPFYFILEDSLTKKIFLISIFLIYNLLISLFNKGKCLGMIIVGTRYEKDYPIIQYVVYSIFYTLSFSTLLFSIFFPFDLFLFNMFLLQLPTVLLTKTTLHGYLSGNVTTVKYVKK
jgi:hypothetical protein